MANLAASSPHSSDGATHHETPSTNFTALSPETVGIVGSASNVQPAFKLSISTDGPPTSHSVIARVSGDDVFLNEPTSVTTGSQLSPVAESFTPGQYNPSSAAMASSSSAGPYMAGLYHPGPNNLHNNATPVSTLLPGSVPDGPRTYVQQVGPDGLGPYMNALTPLPADTEDTQMTIAQLASMNLRSQNTNVPTHLPEIVLREGAFSADAKLGRSILISGIPTNFSELAIRQIFNQQAYTSVVNINFKDLGTYGVVIVGFSNLRDTMAAGPHIRSIQPNWTVRRISPKQYALKCFDSIEKVTDYEGEIIVTVFFDAFDRTILAGPVVATLKQTLATFGFVKAIHAMTYVQEHIRDFRVEFEDTRSATNAVNALQNASIGNVGISLRAHQPDIEKTVMMARPAQAASNQSVLSVTGRSTIPADQAGINHAIRTAPPRDRQDANGSHNQVVISRIEVGLDVRTTIMLRNIPNKVDSSMLKAILDETSHGTYDFMYLRIDFANNCNVGYAFINFVDALDIIPFALARAGKRWDKFGSDKVAEISYATIQGKDCLVQKFRNSSVMLEDPSFRPKLFSTGTGPDAGDEEPFPGPDNVSKMRRSVENAEHVGLFVPNTMASRTQTRSAQPSTRSAGYRLSDYLFAPSIETARPAAREGVYLPPARAVLPPAAAQTQIQALPSVPARPITNPSTLRQPAPQILTPSSSTDSLRSYAYNTQASIPVHVGSSNTTQPAHAFPGSPTIRRPTAASAQSSRLFAPRQGQAYRDEQRRRRSQFDRGTPGAEQEAYNNRLLDPALSASHTQYTPPGLGPRLYGPEYAAYYGVGPSTRRPGYEY